MPPQGSGTELDPYIIMSVADYEFAVLNNAINYSGTENFFELGADITFTADYWDHPGIATDYNQFFGSIDGKGHKLINYTCGTAATPQYIDDPANENYMILFSSGAGYMRNITFENLSGYRTLTLPEDRGVLIDCWWDFKVSNLNFKNCSVTSEAPANTDTGLITMEMYPATSYVHNVYFDGVTIEQTTNRVTAFSNGVLWAPDKFVNCYVNNGSTTTGAYTINPDDNNVTHVGNVVNSSNTNLTTPANTGVHEQTDAQAKSLSAYVALGWDIVDKSAHDGNEATATWYIEDGVDYPRLWYEYNYSSGPGPGPDPEPTPNTKVKISGLFTTIQSQIKVNGTFQSINGV